jgi:hypothetical protein
MAAPTSIKTSAAGSSGPKPGSREAKTMAIAEVKARFDRMTSAVFLDYKGMTVASATKLRASFKKAGVEYKVVKNTVVKHALKGADYAPKLDDVLAGMTGIAWSFLFGVLWFDDPVTLLALAGMALIAGAGIAATRLRGTAQANSGVVES